MNKITEGLQHMDMKGIVKPTIHIDEFVSKMGDDDDIVVLSFYVRDKQASEELVNWFETGYQFILDADMTPGQVKLNRWVVYVEIRRRTALIDQVHELISDMYNLNGVPVDEWFMQYGDNKSVPYDKDKIGDMVPLSPREYRNYRKYLDGFSDKLNSMRQQAGIPHKSSYEHNAS